MVEHDARSLVRKSVWLAFFLAPIVGVGEIVAVAIHEILGHGLAAVALGGRFRGFILRWDGMGSAFTGLRSDASTADRIIRHAAGVTATTVMGLGFLILAYVVRRRVNIRLPLLILSFFCLMEGITYVLWNSYHPVPPGDIGKIITLWRLEGLPGATVIRMILLSVSGIMFIAACLLLFALALQAVEQALLGGERLSGRARFWVLLVFLVIPGAAGSFVFDWNQLAPGIGSLPQTASAGSIVFCAIVVYFFSMKPNLGVPAITITWWHLLVTWGSMIVVMSMTLLWFQNGVRWG